MNHNDQAPSSGDVIGALLGRMWVLNRIASSRAQGGHSPSYYRVLGLLTDSNARRIGDLAAAVHVSQPGMTKIVKALEEAGAVQRGSDPTDSRATLVSITDAGRALLSSRATQIVDLLLPHFAPLSEAERRTLQDAVDILAKHMPGESTHPEEEAR
ncbi:MarR family winged helix-turn-helix transcriptional regulator [Galactobacter valiniphilus]|uniref:MarR family winged helix-turn-helix transcriptional regulator n=1 Tax=Galactobacter valiniphilus TaxID=2676122 RepID=UPI003735A71E